MVNDVRERNCEFNKGNNMKNIISSSIFLCFVSAFLVSCASMEPDLQASTVSPEAVWIDVRTVQEYQDDHIDGDRNMPLQSLNADTLVSQVGLPLDADIRLYCVAGVRAGRAQTIFEQAGFTNVSNAGGISDVREVRKLGQ